MNLNCPACRTSIPRKRKGNHKQTTSKNFKYLGLTVSSDGRCEEEVRRRIQAGWMSWKKVSGVLCDRKLSATVKGKMHKSVVRPAMLYGMETVAVTERQLGKMENGEMGTGSDKKGKDKRTRERSHENRKTRRQISECKAPLLLAHEKERRRLRGKKDDGDGGAR